MTGDSIHRAVSAASTHQVSALIGIINDELSLVCPDMPDRMGVNRDMGTQDHPLIKLISSDGILAGFDGKFHSEYMEMNSLKPVEGMGICFGVDIQGIEYAWGHPASTYFLAWKRFLVKDQGLKACPFQGPCTCRTCGSPANDNYF